MTTIYNLCDFTKDKIIGYLSFVDLINLRFTSHMFDHLIFTNNAKVFDECVKIKYNKETKFRLIKYIFKYDCVNVMKWLIIKRRFIERNFWKAEPKYNYPQIMQLFFDSDYFSNVKLMSIYFVNLLNLYRGDAAIIFKNININHIDKNIIIKKFNFVAKLDFESFKNIVDYIKKPLLKNSVLEEQIVDSLKITTQNLLYIGNLIIANYSNNNYSNKVFSELIILCIEKDTEVLINQLDKNLLLRFGDITRHNIVKKCIKFDNFTLLKYFVDLWNIDLSSSKYIFISTYKTDNFANIINYLMQSNVTFAEYVANIIIGKCIKIKNLDLLKIFIEYVQDEFILIDFLMQKGHLIKDDSIKVILKSFDKVTENDSGFIFKFKSEKIKKEFNNFQIDVILAIQSFLNK